MKEAAQGTLGSGGRALRGVISQYMNAPGLSSGRNTGERPSRDEAGEEGTAWVLLLAPKTREGKKCFKSTETHCSQIHPDVSTKSGANTFIDIFST